MNRDAERHPPEQDGAAEWFDSYRPLTFEEADRILQNVLFACGYEPAHMKKG